MEEKKLLSVIVPVYNAQEFLPDCIESILIQTYQNYKRLGNQMEQIVSPERLCCEEFDYVLIAVKNIETAAEIRDSLIQKGIVKEKIIWNLAKIIEI